MAGKPQPARGRATKVEKGVQVVEQWILAAIRKITFFDLHQLNGVIKEKLEVLNNRPFQNMNGTRRSVYEQIDKSAFKPLPQTLYVFARWKKAIANIDYHISVDHNLYSVPYTLVGHELDVRLTGSAVEVFNRGQRVAIHQRAIGRGQVATEPSHRPVSHQRHLRRCPPMPMSADQTTSTRKPDEMLVEHTITRLNDTRLAGMNEAYSSQREKPNIHELYFDDRFGMR